MADEIALRLVAADVAQDTELVAALVEKGRARATTYTWERCGALTRAALADIR